jgi:hypothetical protein
MQFIAAYTQKGMKLCRFFTGSMDKPLFENFIEQLLYYCGKWPESEIVLIMTMLDFIIPIKFKICVLMLR